MHNEHPMSSYTYMFDLAWFDGPLISVGYNLDDGDGYYDLYDWMTIYEKDGKEVNMWLVLRINAQTLLDLLEHRINYRKIWATTPKDRQSVYFQDGKDVSVYESVDSHLGFIEENISDSYFDENLLAHGDGSKIARWIAMEKSK